MVLELRFSRSIPLRSPILFDAVRRPHEIFVAVCDLRPVDWNRLLVFGKRYSYGRGIDAEDLVQEAIVKALNGERRCPTNVEIIAFLSQTMRSIASNELKKRPELTSTSLQTTKGGDFRDLADHLVDPAANAEENLLLKEQHDGLLSLFADDQDASTLLGGMLDQLKGEPLREFSGLDKLTYDRKRALIRYRINRYYGVSE